MPTDDSIRLVEQLARRWLTIAGAMYSAGFVVTAIHLAQYGVTSFDLIRAHYVWAGVWAFVPFLLILPVPAIVRFVTEWWETIAPIKRHASLLPFMIVFGYLAVLAFAAKLLFISDHEREAAVTHVLTNVDAYLLIAIVFALAGAWRVMITTLRKSRSLLADIMLPGAVTGCVFLFVSILFTYL